MRNGLAAFMRLGRVVVVRVRVVLARPYVLGGLLRAFGDLQPSNAIRAFSLYVIQIAMSNAPLASVPEERL